MRVGDHMVKCMKVAEESSTETVLKLSLTCGAGVPKVRAEDVLASGIRAAPA